MFEDEKILLAGGTGYIGSHTAVELIQAGYEIAIVDNLNNSKISVLDAIEKITGVYPKFYELDLLDSDKLDQVFKTEKYDAVIHFAGLKAVAESVEQPLLYYNNNLMSTLNLLRVMRRHNVSKIIFSSSATVYGNQGVTVLDETMPTGQGITSPYGKTKYMIEEILKDLAMADQSFMPIVLRYFNPVGVHPSGLLGEDSKNRPNNLMPIIMKVATGEFKDLSIYGNDYPTKDGTCIRDYIHVVDLAKGHLAALDYLENTSNLSGFQVFNLGTGRGTSVFEMIAAFEEASGHKLPVRIVPRRAGDLAELIASPKKAEKILGWRAELTVDDAMRDTIKYLGF